ASAARAHPIQDPDATHPPHQPADPHRRRRVPRRRAADGVRLRARRHARDPPPHPLRRRPAARLRGHGRGALPHRLRAQRPFAPRRPRGRHTGWARGAADDRADGGREAAPHRPAGRAGAQRVVVAGRQVDRLREQRAELPRPVPHDGGRQARAPPDRQPRGELRARGFPGRQVDRLRKQPRRRRRALRDPRARRPGAAPHRLSPRRLEPALVAGWPAHRLREQPRGERPHLRDERGWLGYGARDRRPGPSPGRAPRQRGAGDGPRLVARRAPDRLHLSHPRRQVLDPPDGSHVRHVARAVGRQGQGLDARLVPRRPPHRLLLRARRRHGPVPDDGGREADHAPDQRAGGGLAAEVGAV
ncbi:MAG: tolB protein precursor, periplasmic protein involved in the tonb-independent uptake of group A colicins, partial [uncultured Gemmatimonadetes bacterium]